MSNKSVGILTNDIIGNLQLIQDIKSFFQSQNYNDFTIFTDQINNTTQDHSVLITYYVVGHKGLLVFLDINDYLPYKDNLLCQPVIYISANNLSVNRDQIKHCDILTHNESSLQWIKHHAI